jgi:hypothetical protein
MVAFPCRVPEIAVTVTIEVPDDAAVFVVPPAPLFPEQPKSSPRPA